MTTFIKVKNTFEGIHRYKDAPIQVEFLSDYHRHVFVVETKIEVFHDDRELEFIMVKREINEFFKSKMENTEYTYWFMDELSCEQVAIQLHEFLTKKYGKRKMIIEVSEDDENSAILEGE